MKRVIAIGNQPELTHRFGVAGKDGHDGVERMAAELVERGVMHNVSIVTQEMEGGTQTRVSAAPGRGTKCTITVPDLPWKTKKTSKGK